MSAFDLWRLVGAVAVFAATVTIEAVADVAGFLMGAWLAVFLLGVVGVALADAFDW